METDLFTTILGGTACEDGLERFRTFQGHSPQSPQEAWVAPGLSYEHHWWVIDTFTMPVYGERMREVIKQIHYTFVDLARGTRGVVPLPLVNELQHRTIRAMYPSLGEIVNASETMVGRYLRNELQKHMGDQWPTK